MLHPIRQQLLKGVALFSLAALVALAALLVHTVAIDGVVSDEERGKLREILARNFGLSGDDLDRLVAEDDLAHLPLEDAVDRTERDRARVHREGKAFGLARVSCPGSGEVVLELSAFSTRAHV